jgi:hypothetical protein
LFLCFTFLSTCAVVSDLSCDPANGIVHIVTGASGAGLFNDFPANTPKWVEYAEAKEFGYIRGFVRQNPLRVKLEFVESKTREVKDSMHLYSRVAVTPEDEVAFL